LFLNQEYKVFDISKVTYSHTHTYVVAKTKQMLSVCESSSYTINVILQQYIDRTIHTFHHAKIQNSHQLQKKVLAKRLSLS